MKFLIALLLVIPQLVLGHPYADRIIAQTHPTQKFIVADKELGKIFVIDPVNNTEESTPALYGKVISDNVDISYYDRESVGIPYITPAGVFTVTKMYSDILKKDMLVFFEGKYMVMAIHPVYTGNPVQKREERLASDDPRMHRITNGCINVGSEFFSKHLADLDNIKLYILPETNTAKEEWAKFYPEMQLAKSAPN